MPDTFANDPTHAYQEHPFPGRKLLATAIAIIVLFVILPNMFLNVEKLPQGARLVQTILCLLALPLYFIGFWRAIIGKGYPTVFLLLSFVPPIGLLVIYYLPQNHGKMDMPSKQNA